jgi:hypothetical protein
MHQKGMVMAISDLAIEDGLRERGLVRAFGGRENVVHLKHGSA